MRRLFALLLGTAFGGGLVFIAFRYHVVRTSDDVLMIPKTQASLDDVYSDVREWDVQEWSRHGPLANALIARGHGDLVKRSISRNLIESLMRNFDGASRQDSRRQSN